MVHITEIRVVLPMTVEEFKRGQRYANWKTNEYNTKEGQGGQLLSSVPYEHEVWGEGIYTHSLYRLGDRLPDWVCASTFLHSLWSRKLSTSRSTVFSSHVLL
jgi:hypothetical protein